MDFEKRVYDHTIQVIGLGAVGSQLMLDLVRGTDESVRLVGFDPDVVEPHNLFNQAYGAEHVGMQKTVAITHIAKAGLRLQVWAERYEEYSSLNVTRPTITVLGVDSMAARQVCLEFIEAMYIIDQRVGAEGGRVYVFRNTPMMRAKYKETLCLDSEAADRMACGRLITAGPMAAIAAGIACSAVLKILKRGLDAMEDLHNETIFGIHPTSIMTREFFA